MKLSKEVLDRAQFLAETGSGVKMFMRKHNKKNCDIDMRFVRFDMGFV